jgi:hypothetical protein
MNVCWICNVKYEILKIIWMYVEYAKRACWIRNDVIWHSQNNMKVCWIGHDAIWMHDKYVMWNNIITYSTYIRIYICNVMLECEMLQYKMSQYEIVNRQCPSMLPVLNHYWADVWEGVRGICPFWGSLGGSKGRTMSIASSSTLRWYMNGQYWIWGMSPMYESYASCLLYLRRRPLWGGTRMVNKK